MIRSLSILLGLFVTVAACAQDPPMSHDDMEMDEVAGDASDIPPRANDEARPSPNAVVGQTIGTTTVYIQYGRPSLRGRAVFGDGSALAPAGQVWRTGANEATTFTVSADVLVAGERLPAGTYALFTIPGDDAWTVIFNRTAQQWGAFNYDEGEDQLRVTVEPEDAFEVEMLTVVFDDITDTSADLVLWWGETMVSVPIQTTD